MKTDTNSTLDNLAFSLYYEKYKIMSVLPSKHYFVNNKQHYIEYYKKATNIIRKEKLLKLNQTR